MRKQLDRDVQDFIAHGGKIRQVPRGLSGRDPQMGFSQPLFDTPKTTRTYVTELIAGIDARRRPEKPKPGTREHKKPRQKVILDDFGEPIRKIWVDN